MNPPFASRVAGALYGGAIGDSIGAPVEGMLRSEILGLAGPVRGFISPAARVDGAWTLVNRSDGKGDGRITDDTLMVEALLTTYADERRHLDALVYKEVFAPVVAGSDVWIPELRKRMPVVDRLASGEQYQIKALLGSNRDPRFFGAQLFQITCGAAMYAWPIGAANAGDPDRAYNEAVAFFSPQTFSYGLEQAAVMAAAMAAALTPEATARDVVNVALSMARDATGEMIRRATGALTPGADRNADLPAIRAAVQPLHHKWTHLTAVDDRRLPADSSVEPTNQGLESRLHASEELPAALAILLRANGEPKETLCAAAEYGEDADSIAAMAGSLAGALHGTEAIPTEWRNRVDTENRRDFAAMADAFVETLRMICRTDERQHLRRMESIEQ